MIDGSGVTTLLYVLGSPAGFRFWLSWLLLSSQPNGILGIANHIGVYTDDAINKHNPPSIAYAAGMRKDVVIYMDVLPTVM